MTAEQLKEMIDEGVASAFEKQQDAIATERRKHGEAMGNFLEQIAQDNRESKGVITDGVAMLNVKEGRAPFLARGIHNTKKGIHAAKVLIALRSGNGDLGAAHKYAVDKWTANDTVAKQLLASDGTAGGFWMESGASQEIIELLRPAAILRSMGPMIMQLPTASFTLPKMTGGSTASYIGETQNIPLTEPTAGDVRLLAKKLAAIVAMSRDMIRYPSSGSEAAVRADLVASLAQTEDINFIRGMGTEYTPRGLRYWAPSDNLITANTTVNLANVTEDLGEAVLLLMESNVRMINPGWLLTPAAFVYLATVRDGNGNFAFRAELMDGRLWGFPVGVSNQIPANLGAGANESEIYFVDFADVVIGDGVALELETTTEASYWDGTTNQSAFSKDMFLMRAIMEHDLVMRHEESVAVIIAAKWRP